MRKIFPILLLSLICAASGCAPTEPGDPSATQNGKVVLNYSGSSVTVSEVSSSTQAESRSVRGVSSSPASSAPSEVSENQTFETDPDFDWALILVNRDNPLPKDYTVETANYNSARKFDARAIDYLKNMVKAAKSDGIILNVISSYRSVERQTVLFENKVSQYMDKGYSREKAEKKAAMVVAIPGTSEHSTGLAADIVSVKWYDLHSELTEDFDKTKEYDWLEKNAADYGFILRYPKDKEDVTGISYEPWHYRFVGIENAKYISSRGLTLEEFSEMIK